MTMTQETDANWWDIAIRPEVRKDSAQNEILGEGRINPPTEDGRKLLSYFAYLDLDRLLSAQRPASRVPDERVFLITHQLFELVFKQVVFDLLVIAESFHHLLDIPKEDEFLRLAVQPDPGAEVDFWTPAANAARRVRYCCESVLQVILPLVSGSEKTGGQHFSNQEYILFRDYLFPASGFQGGQLRLIQRAMGKGNLLDLQAFPSHEYRRNYQGRAEHGLTNIANELILQEGARFAFPEDGSHSARVAEFEDTAHALLLRLARHASLDGTPPGALPRIEGAAGERAAGILEKQLGNGAQDAGPLAERFRQDFASIMERENARRAALDAARPGAQYLRQTAPGGALCAVLDCLAAADEALHAPRATSFMRLHYDIAREHLHGFRQAGIPMGTAGGGLEYLSFSLHSLLPLFPALIGYRQDAGALAG